VTAEVQRDTPELIDGFLSDPRTRGQLKPSTQCAYRRDLVAAAAALPGIIEQITTACLTAYLAADIALSTVARHTGGSVSTLPTIRLHLLVARAAPRILIIRRGPTRVYHLALWHTDTDTVEHGSWFRGQLYVHRCDLSWDGRWLVYFAMGPTREHYSWTAVSRPPWVKAELFYPMGDTWNGGGVWDQPGLLWLNLPAGSAAREGDPTPGELGFAVRWGRTEYGEDEGPLYRRLERDGWRRDDPPGVTYDRDNAQVWMHSGGPQWALRPEPGLPTLRLTYRGYFQNRGRVFTYSLDEHAGLLDEEVSWAGYDGGGRLVVARGGAVERYTRDDLARGALPFRYDLGGLTPPPPPPPRPRPVVQSEPLAELGRDAQGRYHTAGGQPVLAADEAVLEEQPDGRWAITALNNRSYDYMAGPESWPAVDAALRGTGIRYPDGFAEVHPLEGTWAEILAVLRS
jgi:hypothetical protein